MNRTLLDNARLLDPESRSPRAGALLLEGGHIRDCLAPGSPVAGAERLDLAGRDLAPGFLDLHHHGRVIFEEAASYARTLRQEAAHLLRHGTTGFLPTTVAWPSRPLRARVGALARASAEAEGAAGASVLGIHLEGPWIRPEAAGAQPTAGIRPFALPEGRDLLDRSEGLIRMVTLAPEIEGSGLLLEELARRGVVASLGHSLAAASCVMGAIERGARHVTHLFNAMGPLHHRERGLTGVALSEDRLSCDLICDGVHVHPQIVRLAARAKGAGLLLITDRVDPGAPSAPDFGSGAVQDDGTALRLPDGRLAGSTLTLDRAIRNACAFGAMERIEAVAACTLRPARLLGLEAQRGTLRPGARADLVVLGPQGEVQETWLAGRRAWASTRPGS